MNRKYISAIALMTSLIGGSPLALSEEATMNHPVHEGPSVSIPSSDVTFAPTGVKRNGLELKAGPVYGNLQKGKHGTFVKMPAGFSSAVHTHTQDFYAVVIRGVSANHAPGEEDVPLPVGSYWFQKGEEAHVTKCLSKTECLIFLVQPGKFDYLLAASEENK